MASCFPFIDIGVLGVVEARSSITEIALAGCASKMSRRELLVGSALLATAGASFIGQPRKHVIAVKGSIQSVLPSAFGEWQSHADDGFVMPPADELKAASVYDEQLALTYRDQIGSEVMLLIAYARYQSGLLMVHRPEACYPGSGFTINMDRDISIAIGEGVNIPGRFLSTSNPPREEQVLYWTRLGSAFPISWDEERWTLAVQNLKGFIPDGALIRMSVLEHDVNVAEIRLRKFAADLYEATGSAGRALLLGHLATHSKRL